MIPKALTIAGSDSGGVCGIQADLKTFAALEVYGTSAIAAITSQNTSTMASLSPVPAHLLNEQIDLVLRDIGADAVKTGMLGHAENYRVVAEALQRHHVTNLVVDAVVTCYRGCAYVLEDAQQHAMREYLLPITHIFAVAIPEAEVLLQRPITTIDAMGEAARSLATWGPRYVVIKGGHLEGASTDVVYNGHGVELLRGKRIANPNDNGSGCTFTAAIAAYLAHGRSPLQAIAQAKRYLEEALQAAFNVGQGTGPVHHFSRSWHTTMGQRQAERQE